MRIPLKIDWTQSDTWLYLGILIGMIISFLVFYFFLMPQSYYEGYVQAYLNLTGKDLRNNTFILTEGVLNNGRNFTDYKRILNQNVSI